MKTVLACILENKILTETEKLKLIYNIIYNPTDSNTLIPNLCSAELFSKEDINCLSKFYELYEIKGKLDNDLKVIVGKNIILLNVISNKDNYMASIIRLIFMNNSREGFDYWFQILTKLIKP